MVVLAVVQGVTEFIPVSSSAHLVVVSEIFWKNSHPVSFDIVLHMATLGAVIVYFAKDIRRLFIAFFSKGDSEDRRMAHALVLATLPIMIAGVFVYEVFASLRTLPMVATALIGSGFLLVVADYSIRKKLVRTDIPLLRRGFGIGLLQILALLPGVSRSGITIAGGRLLGFSRKEASRFSFLLAIPVITGALVLLWLRTSLTMSSFGGAGFGTVVLGVLVAFGVAIVAIHLFLKLVERIGFVPFFIYQVALGTALLIIG